MSEESQFLKHIPCENCGSSDANSLYSDGHQHCFSCGVTVKGSDEVVTKTSSTNKTFKPIPSEPFEVSKRKIKPATFQHWKYNQGEFKGESVHVANFYDKGKLVGQKLRFKDKRFISRGKCPSLYGMWLWKSGGRRVVVTEGEIDALSVSDMQGNKWPVVSLTNGASAAAKAFKENIDYLCGFDEVVICFDNDEPGQEAAIEAAQVLPPGKAFIAYIPDGYKDANDLLKAGKSQMLNKLLWDAQAYRPDGIVTVSDLLQDVLVPTEVGMPWVWDSLTRLTYGRRYGEVYYLGAGTGVGKTDVLTENIVNDAITLSQSVGVFFLEQPPTETVKRLAGKLTGKRFHVPDSGWVQQELEDAVGILNRSKVYLYDNFGSTEWDTVSKRIRYMATALEVKHIYLDHLTALASGTQDERVELERITKEIAMLAQELNICIYVVSHLSTPDGKPHEEGGRVMIRHFKGSRAIGYWAHYMFGLERDQQAEDEAERHTTTFRVLKDRYTGQATGRTFYLRYEAETGHLREVSPEFDGADDCDEEDLF